MNTQWCIHRRRRLEKRCFHDDGDEKVRKRRILSPLVLVDENESSESFVCTSTGSLFEEKINNDILFHMMCHTWESSMFFPGMLVCRRWSLVGKRVKMSLETTRSIAHGIYVDHTHLQRIAHSPCMEHALLDTPLLAALCKTVNTKSLLEIFLSKGIKTRAQWLACLTSAIDNNNAVAVGVLVQLGQFVVETDEEMVLLLKRACKRTSIAALRALISGYSVLAFSNLRRDTFVQWCCKQDLSVFLLELLNYDTILTNGQCNFILVYALKGNNEPLVQKLISRNKVELHLLGPIALKKACEQGWTSVAGALIERRGVNPTHFPNQELLRLAISNGNLAIVRILLVHPQVDPGYDANKPLRDAVITGQFDIALFLLSDHRVLVQNHTSAVESLLCLACAQTALNPTFVSTLFERGVDPNEYNRSPARIAMLMRNYPVLRLLLAHPRFELSKSDHVLLLDSLMGVQGCLDMVEKLVHERKYAQHFDV